MAHAIQNGYKGLSLLFVLNWDRILYVTAIVMALASGALLHTVLS
ncbi:hypothetical protein [Oceanicola sp. 22II-s10i]|nr:hypothetical protein [Oceanicola sp. 22II-s10i]